MQATIDSAVAATVTAIPPESTTEYVTMTEEELAMMIDEAVVEAAAASEDYYAASQDAASDGTITEDELAAMYDTYYAIDEAIALAEELIGIYYYFYGDLATETLALLYMIEDDLATLAATAMALDAALQELDAALSSGAPVSEETITQLLAAAETAAANAGAAEAQIEDVQAVLQAELANRVAEMLSTAPTTIPNDRVEAIQAGFAYVDAIRGAMADERVTAEELAAIAQLGANASAGLAQLEALEGAQLPEFFTGASSITAYLASGQNMQAMASLATLEGTLDAIPGASGFGRRP
jgi:hypothetical protein